MPKHSDIGNVKKHRNHGLRKLCDCARSNWPKCRHSWYFNFKPRDGPAYQFSLDAELDTHISRCNPVVSEGETGLPLNHNEREESVGKVTVN